MFSSPPPPFPTTNTTTPCVVLFGVVQRFGFRPTRREGIAKGERRGLFRSELGLSAHESHSRPLTPRRSTSCPLFHVEDKAPIAICHTPTHGRNLHHPRTPPDPTSTVTFFVLNIHVPISGLFPFPHHTRTHTPMSERTHTLFLNATQTLLALFLSLSLSLSLSLPSSFAYILSLPVKKCPPVEKNCYSSSVPGCFSLFLPFSLTHPPTHHTHSLWDDSKPTGRYPKEAFEGDEEGTGGHAERKC